MEATATALRESPLTPVMEHRFAPGRVRAASLLGSLAWLLAGTLFFCGVWLLVRRMSGSLAVPLDSGMLLAVGVCGVVSAATARLLWRRTSDEGTDPARLVRDLLPTVALVLLATAAAVPMAARPRGAAVDRGPAPVWRSIRFSSAAAGGR
jgi:hypothetical protein